MRLLQDLRGLDDAAEPTEIGRQLARFPVDPRIGRIVLAGRDEGCLPEALVTAAALSWSTHASAGGQSSRGGRSAGPLRRSALDFLVYLALWDELQEKLDQPTRGPLRRGAASRSSRTRDCASGPRCTGNWSRSVARSRRCDGEPTRHGGR